jgi:hypothetical protein
MTGWPFGVLSVIALQRSRRLDLRDIWAEVEELSSEGFPVVRFDDSVRFSFSFSPLVATEPRFEHIIVLNI